MRVSKFLALHKIAYSFETIRGQFHQPNGANHNYDQLYEYAQLENSLNLYALHSALYALRPVPVRLS